MTTTIRSLTGSAVLGALVLTIASCGGNGASGLRVEPAETRASETVLLIGEGLEEGDTVCFAPKGKGTGCGFPSVLEGLEAVGENEMQARVTLPGLILPGEYEIRIGRGDEFGGSADVTVLPRSTSPKAAETAPEETGETIVPEGTPPADPNPYEDYANGDNLPDVPTPEALAASLEGTEVLHETSLGMVKFNYKAAGGIKALYLYGPFTPDGDCDDKLAIDPSGNELNVGSPNYIRYQGQYSGKICDAALGNCRGYEPVPGVVQCRIDLAEASGGFYGKLRQKDSKFTLVAEGVNGEIKTATRTFTAPAPEIFPDVSVTADGKSIKVGLDFTGAVTAQIAGCVSAGGNPVFRGANGTGSSQALCALKKDQTVTVTASGLASQNVQQVIRVSLGQASFEVNKGSVHCDPAQTVGLHEDCPGTVKYFWKVNRPYAVENMTTGRTETGTVPAVKSVELHSRDSGTGDLSKRDSKEGGEGVFDVRRDHVHLYHQFRAIDFDGTNAVTYHTFTDPFPLSFSMSEAKTVETHIDYADECDSYNPADWGGNCETCNDIDSGRLDVSIKWRGQHIREIRSLDCPGFEVVRPNAGVYDVHGGTMRGTIDFGTNLQRSISCTFQATSFNEKKMTFTQAWDGGCHIVTGGM
jgi:hypothetical protein